MLNIPSQEGNTNQNHNEDHCIAVRMAITKDIGLQMLVTLRMLLGRINITTATTKNSSFQEETRNRTTTIILLSYYSKEMKSVF
jgi:hypothetical protein